MWREIPYFSKSFLSIVWLSSVKSCIIPTNGKRKTILIKKRSWTIDWSWRKTVEQERINPLPKKNRSIERNLWYWIYTGLVTFKKDHLLLFFHSIQKEEAEGLEGQIEEQHLAIPVVVLIYSSRKKAKTWEELTSLFLFNLYFNICWFISFSISPFILSRIKGTSRLKWLIQDLELLLHSFSLTSIILSHGITSRLQGNYITVIILFILQGYVCLWFMRGIESLAFPQNRTTSTVGNFTLTQKSVLRRLDASASYTPYFYLLLQISYREQPLIHSIFISLFSIALFSLTLTGRSQRYPPLQLKRLLFRLRDWRS